MKAVQVGSRLLDGLPARDRNQVLAVSERVDLTVGDVLQEPGGQIEFVYFPISGMISLLIPVKGRGNFEVGLVGSEGFLGIPAVLGVRSSPLQGLVQGAGTALRVGEKIFCHELDSSAALRRAMSRYAYVLMAQIAETVGCVKFHLLEARLARWLLMTHDRASSNQFHLTHEFLAQMLGVRRVGVTNAAGALQKRKLIAYTRGEIVVLDRAGLEAASCPCYQTGQEIYELTFGSQARSRQSLRSRTDLDPQA
jgi:CRP-like cAMP-binding protein